MIIMVKSGRRLELCDAENFRAFKILNEGRLGRSDLAAALKDIATLTEDGSNAWVKRTAVAALLPEKPAAEWSARFDNMIEVARQYGWVDGVNDTIRAHIETP
jgi:hypothetical protein